MDQTGIVKSFLSRDGYGYIFSRDGDVFVHVSNILENSGNPADILIPGEHVEYEIIRTKRGATALRVRRLSPPRLPRQIGRVKRIFEHKGYGFIESAEGDVFFSYTDLMFDEPRLGENVKYYLARVRGKTRAVRVRRPRYG